MFALDDRLYDFPQFVDTRLWQLSDRLPPMSAPERDASLPAVHQAFEEQRAALREQQQVLTALVQEYTRLLTLQREYQQLVEESYPFVLGKMFWLRDATVLNWDVVQESLAGAVDAAKRFQVLMATGRTYVETKITGAVYLWLVEIVIFLGVPWLVYRLTLAPLIQTPIKVGVIFAAVLIILEQLGVSTGPLLTGVGIFGLAVGFASQSLIKDVINGLFLLCEDSLSVGDVVTLRGIGGQVEKVTLRAVTIRDLTGNVHVIPNSTIDMITNMTKEYSRYVLDVGVAYREDVDKVVAILREIDESLRRDVAFGKDMLEPLEVMGLDRFEDSAVIVRARLKTRPLQQWRIGREFNRRIKKVFDERGIEMPFPHRTLYWGQTKEGPPTPLRVAMENNRPVQREDNYCGC